MKHIKEFFDFLKKKEEPKSWQQKFEMIWSKYQKFKNKENVDLLDRPDIDIRDDNFSASLGYSPHLVFYKKNKKRGDMVVIDFDVCDYAKPDSDEGVYKIIENEYNLYLKKAEEISDWLDGLSERETGKSHITVGIDGDIELDETDLALDELNFKLKEEMFDKFIGKTFEFEVDYYIWKSTSSNERVVDRQDFKVDDITIGCGGGRFWAQIWVKDMFNRDSYLWIESDSNPNYVDLEKLKPWEKSESKIIRMNVQDPEMNRKQRRESDKNQKYPHVISYEATPSKYNTIEFIKEIKELLTMVNDQIKK